MPEVHSLLNIFYICWGALAQYEKEKKKKGPRDQTCIRFLDRFHRPPQVFRDRRSHPSFLTNPHASCHTVLVDASFQSFLAIIKNIKLSKNGLFWFSLTHTQMHCIFMFICYPCWYALIRDSCPDHTLSFSLIKCSYFSKFSS